MTAYTVHLTLGGQTATRDVVGDSPAALAAGVHRHARGMLGSRAVNIDLDVDTLTGTITSHGATVGTFAADQPTSEPAVREPLHGYTATDIDHLTRKTIAAGRWSVDDVQEHHDAIRYAIVTHLLTAPARPSRSELIGVGLRAGDDRIEHEMHHHGWDRGNLAAGSGGMPSYQRYWQATPTPSPENRVVDQLAREQIWPLLSPREQQALAALRDTGDYQAAADVLGITLNGFGCHISAGRRRFLSWWHEGEAPSRPWRTDKRVGSRDGTCRGVPRLTVSQVEEMRDRRANGALLRELAAEAGASISTVSRLLRGDVQPAPDSAEAA